MSRTSGSPIVCLLWIVPLALHVASATAVAEGDASTCRALLEAGDRAFDHNDARTATEKWRAGARACADTRLDPWLRAKALLRQSSLPESSGREASLLVAAERLLDRGNLEHTPLLAEILRRQALDSIGRGDFQTGEASLVDAAELLRARFGEGSPEELNVRIELESQRIALAAQRRDAGAIQGAVESLERILRAQENGAATDRGIAIALNSALIDGYEALGRETEAEQRRLELNRLLH